MTGYAIVAINVATFFIFGFDKLMAKLGMRRVPEKILLGLVLLSGASGGLFGMVLFNHKTSKALFRYGVPILLGVQLWAAWWFGLSHWTGLRI